MKVHIIRKATWLLLCFVLVSWMVPSRPGIHLIGDSISVQYWPYLKEYLAGRADIDRKKDDGQAEKNLDVPTGANGGDSRMVLEYLRARFKDPSFNPDYVLLNCGLHDIKHDPQTGVIQVEADNYRENLSIIFTMLLQKGIRPIWIRTTWVVDSVHNSRSSSIVRYAADVDKYNAIADEMCREYNIPSIDLYEFSKGLGIERVIDHVHYDDATRSLQAAYIAGFVQNILSGGRR
ncbi:MAG: SGNH/GDSL hydrolase family protein [Bacteroides sp.]|nr:SGNH/GDSL hydrolase family protein [Bacteroides sp.]